MRESSLPMIWRVSWGRIEIDLAARTEEPSQTVKPDQIYGLGGFDAMPAKRPFQHVQLCPQ